MENLREFDKRDHTLLGWLQLAAEALEIWFGLVAAALVYLLTFMIAGKSDGLPIGYLMRPSEFADVPGLCDPSLWKTMSPVFNARDLAGRRTYRLKIVLYVVFTVTLCILCNLMGPATAVLAIPSLQWIKTPPVGNRVFDTLNSASAPTLATLGSFNDTNCTEADMRNLSFSCAANPFATQLDSWIESYLASDRYVNGDAQELGVKFHLNQTFRASNSNVLTQDYSDVTWWTPCRQVLMSLELDRGLTVATSFGSYNDTLQDELESYDPGTSDTPETYEVYNRSIQMIIQRNGPIIGAIVQWHHDYTRTQIWSSIIDDGRQVRCYRGYDLASFPLAPRTSAGNFTKCLRVGDGWSADNKQVNFVLHGFNDSTNAARVPDVIVNVTTSDKAQFFADGVLTSWLPPACLDPRLVPSSVICDWDRLFYTDPDDHLFNRTQNVVTIEMVQNTTYSWKLTVDFVAFLNFTTYQLDPSPLTNPMLFVQAPDLPKSGDVIKVDPAWVLAAWAVDNGGILYADRTATIEVLRIMRYVRGSEEYSSNYMALLPIMQTLSLIDFTTEDVSTVSSTDDARHPILTRKARLYVWAYGFSSRTSKLGLVVVILGIIVVLVHFVLGFIDRRTYKSPTELLVAALEYRPSNEFKEVGDEEARVVSMRFRVQDTLNNAGRYSFKKTEADVW